jgi:hypothetical protein
MKGRRPPFWNRDTQIPRATQASLARKKRSPTLPLSEPTPPPADAPKLAAEVMPVGQTVGMMEAGYHATEAYRAARRMALYEQPSQRLPLLSEGVQDVTSATTDRSVDQLGSSTSAAMLAVMGAPAMGSPPTVTPSVGDIAGSSFPDPTELQGAEAKTGAGELTAEIEPRVVSFGTFSPETTTHTIVIQAPKEPLDLDAGILAASTEQRPAAYRFELRYGKIDVLPEAPEPEDREFALDTYAELTAKVRELYERVKATNSAPSVVNNVERLLTALGTQFDDLRPGVLLSRSRSLEADRAALGDELLPDIIAMMDGTARTLRDLLALFPRVRRIEAEVLALDLDRIADAIPAIREQMAAIKAAAEKSGAVTEEAIIALTQNDAAIEDATDPVVRTSLIADKLLVVGNFARAVIGGIASCGRRVGTELGELAGKSWQAIKDELPTGIGATARIAPLVGLVTLAGVIAGPAASVASIVPAFKPISEALKNAIKDGLRDTVDGKAKDKPKSKRLANSRKPRD